MEQGSENNQVLLILMPWEPPKWFMEAVPAACPGIKVIHHTCDRHGTEVPPEISHDTWKSATILFTWNAIPQKDLCPNLRLVQLLSAGCNHVIGTSLFEETDVAFCTANGVHPPQMAEWVIATYLSFQHHILGYWDDQKVSRWRVPESDEDTEDAVGCRMGVLGYGCVGRQCAKLAQALGMDVHAYTLREKATAESKKDDSYVESGMGDPTGDIPSRWFHGPEQLDEFLGGVDLLVITLPLTTLTRGLIGKKELDILGKRRAFISNVGRGPILRTDDLTQALNDGTIKGAALDVTDPEPLPADSPLWKAKNVIITPHVSGNSMHYNERVLNILLENIKRRAQGKKLMNLVNRELGY